MFQNILTLDPKDDDFVVLSGDEDEDGGDDCHGNGKLILFFVRVTSKGPEY